MVTKKLKMTRLFLAPLLTTTHRYYGETATIVMEDNNIRELSFQVHSVSLYTVYSCTLCIMVFVIDVISGRE